MITKLSTVIACDKRDQRLAQGSAATKQSILTICSVRMDCFAALAMTEKTTRDTTEDTL